MLQSNTFLWIEVVFLWKVHKVSGELLKYSFNIVTMYISNEHFFLWELFIYFLFQQIINEHQTLIYLLDYLQIRNHFNLFQSLGKQIFRSTLCTVFDALIIYVPQTVRMFVWLIKSWLFSIIDVMADSCRWDKKQSSVCK